MVVVRLLLRRSLAAFYWMVGGTVPVAVPVLHD
jgi:hypothetical protein